MVVAATTVVAIVGCGFGGMNAGLFIRPMEDDIGISRTAFGWAIAARQFGGALVSPIGGRLVDRHGGRPGLLIGGFTSCIALMGLALATETWHVVVAFGLVGMSGIVGPGALAVTTPVTKWFERDRARAIAWMSLGVPVGTVIFVPVTQALIDAFGWRSAWTVLGVLSVATVIPAALFVRRRPEDHGLRPDGTPTVATTRAMDPPAATVVAEPATSSAEVFRSAVFWRLVLVFGLVMLANASVGLHRLPHWVDQGIDPGLVSWATSLDAACAGVGTMVVGRLAGRHSSRRLGSLSFLLLAFAVLLTILSSGPVMMFVSMATFGSAIGCLLMIQNYIWVDYFGREHVGRIRGRAMPVTLLCSAAGPVLAGAVFEATDSYDPVWWAGIGLMVAGACLLAMTPRPLDRVVAVDVVGEPASIRVEGAAGVS